MLNLSEIIYIFILCNRMWQISKYDTQWDWFWYLVRELEYLLLIFRCCSYCYFLLSLVTHFWSKIDCYFNMSYNILCQQCRPTVGISKVRCEHIIEVWYNHDIYYISLSNMLCIFFHLLMYSSFMILIHLKRKTKYNIQILQT